MSLNKLSVLICLLLPMLVRDVLPQTSRDQKIKNLKSELQEIREKLSRLENTEKDTAAEIEADLDEELERELAEELGMQTAEQTATSTTQSTGISQETMRARRSFFQNMNPNISVVGTMMGNASTLDGLDRNVDLAFEEAEFSFQAVIDPYARADFYVTLIQEEESAVLPASEEGEEEEEEGGLKPEVEEAFVTFLHLPLSTQLKAGKFRGKFGKINETHPHALNFIGVPQMYQSFFGPEGMNDEGVSLGWLLPNKAFFQELTVQVTRGPGENRSFTRAEDNRLVYLAHLKNFFDLNDNTTLELGVSGLTGPNNASSDVTNIFGGDLTLKWRPLEDRTKSFEFINEFMFSNREAAGEDINSFGFFSHLRYQLARRWYIGALFDYTEFPSTSEFNHQAISGIGQFLLSEFQKVETQVKFNTGNFFDDFVEFRVRAVFVIGAHGAHRY